MPKEVYVGSTQLTANDSLYVGGQPVTQIYVGSTLVWETVPPTLSPSLLVNVNVFYEASASAQTVLFPTLPDLSTTTVFVAATSPDYTIYANEGFFGGYTDDRLINQPKAAGSTTILQVQDDAAAATTNINTAFGGVVYLDANNTSGQWNYHPNNVFNDLAPNKDGFDYFTYITDAGGPFTMVIKVLASEEVDAELNNFTGTWEGTGTNWVNNKDGSHTHTAGDTTALTIPLSGMTVDEVYQVVVGVTGRTAGTVTSGLAGTPNVTGDAQALAVNAKHVDLIRAPTSPTGVTITPTSDFDGTVNYVSVRRVVTDSANLKTPTLTLTAINQSGDINLKWVIDADGNPPTSGTKEFTGVPFYSDQFAIRDVSGTGTFWVHDCYAEGHRGFVSLKGCTYVSMKNCQWVGPSYRVDVNYQYQNGYTGQDSGGTPAQVAYLNNCDTNLNLVSSQGDYGTQNSDCNTTNETNDAWTQYYEVNCRNFNGSDACFDNKCHAWVSHSTFSGAYRQIRNHQNAFIYLKFTDHLNLDRTNSPTYPGGGGLWMDDSNQPFAHIFRTRWEDASNNLQEYWNVDDMVPGQELAPYTPSVPVTEADKRQVIIATSIPRMVQEATIKMTDMEFQQSPNGVDTWTTLTVPDTSPSGVYGYFDRDLSIAVTPTYIRCRVRNGPYTGGWSNIEEIYSTQTLTQTNVIPSGGWFPQQQLANVCFSNGFLEIQDWLAEYPGLTDSLVAVNGERNIGIWRSDTEGITATLPSGARLLLTHNGRRLQYWPNSAYDYLNPGETAQDTFTITPGPELYETSVISWPTYGHLFAGGGFSSQGDGSYYKDPTNYNNNDFYSNDSTYLNPLTVGAWYRLEATFDQRNSAGDPTSAQWIQFGFEGGSMQSSSGGNGTRVFFAQAPAVDARMRFNYYGSWGGFLSGFKMEKVDVTTGSYNYSIQVRASEDVEIDLHDDGDFTGTNWVHDGSGGYTHTAGSTVALSKADADITGMTANALYEVSYSITGWSAGTVQTALVGATTSLAEETRSGNYPALDYHRCPATPTSLEFRPSSDFDGKIINLYVRKVVRTGSVPTPAFQAASAYGSNLLELDWQIPTVGDANIPRWAAMNRSTGVLSYSSEFGIRDTSQYPGNDGDARSRYIYDATVDGKRSGISVRGGPYFITNERVVINGPYAADPFYQYQYCWTMDGFTSESANELPYPEYWLIDCYGDLKAYKQHGGTYNPNSDCITAERGSSQKFGIYRVLDTRLLNAGDGNIDSKAAFVLNCCYLENGYWNIRMWGGHHVIYSTVMKAGTIPDGGNFGSTLNTYWINDDNVRMLWWNSRVTSEAGNPVVIDQEARNGQWFTDNALRNTSSDRITEAEHVANVMYATSYPRMPDRERWNITDVEIEWSPADAGTWTSVPNVEHIGIPHPRGDFHREIQGLTPGTYDFRMRCRNGETDGSWSTIVEDVEITLYILQPNLVQSDGGNPYPYPDGNQILTAYVDSNPINDPTDITGCRLWLDGTDTNSMSLNGAEVTAWTNKGSDVFTVNKYDTVTPLPGPSYNANAFGTGKAGIVQAGNTGEGFAANTNLFYGGYTVQAEHPNTFIAFLQCDETQVSSAYIWREDNTADSGEIWHSTSTSGWATDNPLTGVFRYRTFQRSDSGSGTYLDTQNLDATSIGSDQDPDATSTIVPNQPHTFVFRYEGPATNNEWQQYVRDKPETTGEDEKFYHQSNITGVLCNPANGTAGKWTVRHIIGYDTALSETDLARVQAWLHRTF